MPTTVALNASRSAVFDADGVATVEFRNGGISKWLVKLTAISTTSTNQTECAVYRGPASALNQIDYADPGNGNSSDTNYPVQVGEFITVQWVGGTPGAIATVRIEGDDIYAI